MFGDHTHVSTGGTCIGATIQFDYNTNTSTSEKNNYSLRPPFNGDASQFSWWKNKMYSHIIEVDDELWGIIEDNVTFHVDLEGMVVDRKSLTQASYTTWFSSGSFASFTIFLLFYFAYSNQFFFCYKVCYGV